MPNETPQPIMYPTDCFLDFRKLFKKKIKKAYFCKYFSNEGGEGDCPISGHPGLAGPPTPPPGKNAGLR